MSKIVRYLRDVNRLEYSVSKWRDTSPPWILNAVLCAWAFVILYTPIMTFIYGTNVTFVPQLVKIKGDTGQVVISNNYKDCKTRVLNYRAYLSQDGITWGVRAEYTQEGNDIFVSIPLRRVNWNIKNLALHHTLEYTCEPDNFPNRVALPVVLFSVGEQKP